MKTDQPGLERALWRYTMISQVKLLVLAKMSLAEAIARVCKMQNGADNSISRASLYRWYHAYRKSGFDGLFDRPRKPQPSSLPPAFMQFIREEKEQDHGASIPEVIRRARELGIIGAKEPIDRSTVYRAARSLNLPIFKRKKYEATAMRPFAYEHRMMLVMCDGKHFRAGGSGAKRVALIFIDDATRYVLDIFVGFSEDTEFFLRSLYRILETFGHMDSLYLDHGPGFISDDTKKVMATLNIPLIHGKKKYPEGHAKIERFNSTITQDLLRGLKKPEIDPACQALELRLRHYIRERYNRQTHSAFDRDPESVFHGDGKTLHFPLSEPDLKRAFIVRKNRLVRKDNIIEHDGQPYEMPLGYAGRVVTIYSDILSAKVSFNHKGQLLVLEVPDLGRNARERRASVRAEQSPQGPITTAAELHFNRDFSPIVADDGGFPEPPTR
jgi:transposase InsO family protein